MCFACPNKVPKDVTQLDKFSHDACTKHPKRPNVGQIAIAYTVCQKKRWWKINCEV